MACHQDDVCAEEEKATACPGYTPHNVVNSAGPVPTQTHTAPTAPLERNSSIPGILEDCWAVQRFVVLRVAESKWWKEPGLWFVTQWLPGSEPLLLLHKIVSLPRWLPGPLEGGLLGWSP